MKPSDDMDTKRAKYLSELLERREIRPTSLSLEIGGTRNLISNILSRKTKSPQIQTWEAIAKQLGVPAAELLLARPATKSEAFSALLDNWEHLSEEDRQFVMKQIDILASKPNQ